MPDSGQCMHNQCPLAGIFYVLSVLHGSALYHVDLSTDADSDNNSHHFARREVVSM